MGSANPPLAGHCLYADRHRQLRCNDAGATSRLGDLLAAVAAIPFLGEILEHGADWPRETVLDILIDYSYSFVPELRDMNGLETSAKQVESMMRESIVKLRPLVEKIANAAGSPPRLRVLAQELLEP
jgi:hypothetical protein